MFPLRSFPLALAASIFLFSPALIAQESAPQVRIVQRIDENNLVTLKGNTHPLARAQYDRGRVSPDLSMDGLILVLQRSPEQQADFDRFVASQSDPGSPNYHHWLEPEEVGERFGPAEADVNTIEGWLRGHGFTVDGVPNDRMSIRFSGTAAQVEEAFHTQIHNLDINGVKHIANMSDPRIPAALAPVVMGPKALHNFRPHPLHKLGSKVVFNREKGRWQRVADDSGAKVKAAVSTVARPQFGINDPNAGLLEDVTPYDFAAIYNVLPAWNSGIDGTGQTIAIAGTTQIEPGDVAKFRSQFGLLPIASFTQVSGNGINPGVCTSTASDAICGISDLIENSLDVEWSGAVAKGANIILVYSGNNSAGTIDTVFDSAQYVVNHKTAPILNVSYGLCELGEGTAGNASYNQLWQTAFTEGIAVFVATGDSGSASCDEGGDEGGANVPYAAEYGLSVSGIASTQYNTAVGGTDLFWCDFIQDSNCTTAATYWNTTNSAQKSNAKGYIPEVPWNATCVSKIGIEAAGYWDNQLYQSGVPDLPNTPTDAEQACNFYLNWFQTISEAEGPDLAGLIDTVGGGGGKSNCTVNDGQDVSSCKDGYAKPSWQAGVTGIPSDGHRDLPDVSFFASNGFLGSAYLICVSADGACTYTDTLEPSAQEVGGTSGASPAMAGVMALINQRAGAPQGNPNAELYKLAAKRGYSGCSAESVTTSSSCYFNDIDTQSNVQVCDDGALGGTPPFPDCQVIHSGDEGGVGTLEGYAATAGFDLATGLGSLNVANVVNAWPAETVPEVTLSATTLGFAGTLKGTKSAAKTITLKNSGHAALALTGTGHGITISGADKSSFLETNTCGASVAVGASCLIGVTFKPAAAGALTASLSIGDNAFGSPQTVAISGKGTIPGVKLSAISLTFPGTAVGGSAASQVNLVNTGSAALSLKGTGLGITIVGANPKSFVESNNCGASLAAGRSCTITVTFVPKQGGALSAALAIADDAPASPQKVTLHGTGNGPGMSLSATGLTFPATEVGKESVKKTVTLKSDGTKAISLSKIYITGGNVYSFVETNSCGKSLAPGKSCAIGVIFKPHQAKKLTSALAIADNVHGSPQVIPLTGTGK
ncbi:MAG: choice-of-anchor D domain-containing protein [Terracidiphilus sp.]